MKLAIAASMLLIVGTALAQTPTNPTSRVIFPAKGQSAKQQAKDEQKCYDWAKTNSGIDPAVARQIAEGQAAMIQQPQGGGAVSGAAKGALIGGAAGAVGDKDKSDAAQMGAVVGGLAGGMRRNQQAAAAQKQQQQVQQQYTSSMQKWDRAYVTCMQGTGYTVN